MRGCARPQAPSDLSGDGIGFGRFSCGLRPTRQVLPSAKVRAALSHIASSGYADVKQHGEAAISIRIYAGPGAGAEAARRSSSAVRMSNGPRNR